MPAKKSGKKAATPSVDLTQWNNFDALPPVGDGPARGIVRKTPYRIVGGLDVPGRTIYPAEWESYLERASISTLLMCQDIESFATQPQELIYRLQGLPRSCFPDLFVTGGFGTAYVEVKPLEILVSDENIERYIEVARRLRATGSAIFFFIDTDILVEPRVKTVMFLNRYARTILSAEALGKTQQIADKKILPLKQLQAEAGLTLRDVYAMLAQRHLSMDLSTSLRSDSFVWLPSKSLPELSFGGILASSEFSDLLAELSLGRRPTDKRQLALAKAGRQRVRRPAGLSMVGDFPRRKAGSRIYEPLDLLRDDGGQPTTVDGKKSQRAAKRRGVK
ncbi:hypothetical protein [Paraburkholderia xenovorans]|uniref:hypothetical protein n=1 Tax=Paraburkholderia xenovorans TaxID=36873 RepID=UPI0015C521BA|nr:hypothetical protein [Paraburkholderia xenovorans]NPT37489.1 hypothetical protein [Paraburkholderia xenovorans]